MRATSVAAEKALVTGATGYVGSRLVRALTAAGWQVCVVVRKESDITYLEGLPTQLACLHYDGRTESLLEAVSEVRPSVIFHLAAQGVVEHQPQDIEGLMSANLVFGTQLLEAALRAGTPFFINTGTFWQFYGGRAYNPVNLYAATKQAFEDILRFYSECSSLRALTLTLSHVYGPQDKRGKFFQQLEKAYATGEPLAMTPGHQGMDLVYIDDVVRAYLHAAKLLRRPSPPLQSAYAVRSGRRLKLRDVVKLYERVTHRKVPVRWGVLPYRAREVMVPWAQKKLPGWKPQIDLATGIRLMTSPSVQEPWRIAAEG